MGKSSAIQWTDATWNVARGCTKVSEECKFCYMMRDSLNDTRYISTTPTRTKTVFNFPLKYKRTNSECWGGRPLIFTSSLTDVFHVGIDPFRNEIWDIIRKCPHLIFQILTKRPERILECLPPDWGTGWDNVWLGTSVGLQKNVDKIKDLLKVPAKVRFVSMEPLLGPVDITNKGLDNAYSVPTRFENGKGIEWTDPGDDFIGLDWVIVGGESGNDNGKWLYRPCELQWMERIVQQCLHVNVPVFVKQLGTHLSKEKKLKSRHGGNIEEFPTLLQIREFPRP